MDDVAVDNRQRVHVHVSGLVQGVGFRPFVYRTADEFGLSGYVENNDRGVDIEIEGLPVAIELFLNKIEEAAPRLASVASVEVREVARVGTDRFQIRSSERSGAAATRISPDAAICDDCLRELYDPSDRRHRYPFINCTNCGPRYTIVEGIPYDRPLTSMKHFEMCPECSREYHDPLDRRFHAQPNACPVCGPHVSLMTREGELVDVSDPIGSVHSLLASGHIVAVKGLGGFHLAVDPHNDQAVRRLRARKGRAEKPFALMARDLDVVSRYCNVTPEERRALSHHARPIVLLEAREEEGLAASVAPACHTERSGRVGVGITSSDMPPACPPSGEGFLASLGMTGVAMTEFAFMLPYTPLHFLLLDGQLDVLVMTSANLSEEPIAIGNDEALERLRDIADYFLIHDRDILQRCDDSVVRVQGGAMVPIRRSRGFVPDPVPLPFEATRTILACGGELKNTIGLVRGASVFLSQHIGDLDNPSAYGFFEHSIRHLESILEIQPEVVAFDMHPEYLSSKWAREQDLPGIAVQHHHAHLAAVMAENGVLEPTIGIILDGTGYGTDGSIWGGEVLVGDLGGFDRFAWLRPFRLPGGEAAIRHPWRTAYALLMTSHPERSEGPPLYPRDANPLRSAGPEPAAWVDRLLPFKTTAEREVFNRAFRQGINAPLTSSCGRLFDGVSALLGLCREVNYEGQAAIALEWAATCHTLQGLDEVGAVTPEGSAVTRDGRALAEGLAVTPEGSAVTRDGRAFTEDSAVTAEGSAVTPGFSPGQGKAQIDSPAGFNPLQALSDDLPSAAELKDRGPLDWTPIVRKIVHDLHAGASVSVIARSFHLALSDLFVDAAVRAREETGINRVGLSGGVFQNQLLFHDMRAKLETEGFEVVTHRLVPTNDGGLAYGQAAVAARRTELADLRSGGCLRTTTGTPPPKLLDNRSKVSRKALACPYRFADLKTRRLKDSKTNVPRHPRQTD